MVTVQAPVPLHAPLHPVNAKRSLACADNCTLVPIPYRAEQVDGQLMPLGLLVTAPPLADPPVVMVRAA